MRELPQRLRQGLLDGTWRDPGPRRLGSILGTVSGLPDMMLFATTDAMESAGKMLDTHGLVDDPEFCMTRRSLDPSCEPRLAFPDAIFVAGSRVPGEDVLVAVASPGDRVMVLDWSRPVPNRWVPLMTLDAFCDALSR